MLGERMKQKTHSGAKKRMRAKPGGKVKRHKVGLRHRLWHHSSKLKRHLGQGTYVDDANSYQVERLLVL
jgi:large subunit ribosomal protein L35